MAAIETLFATKLYRETLKGAAINKLNEELARACCVIAKEDAAGRAWSKEHGYRGYTSYASLNDLAWRSPTFAELQEHLDAHAGVFAKAVDFDLGGRKPRLDSMWINILSAGGVHTGHIHPHSIISGTYYVSVPDGSSALKLEDPRLPLMMAAPPRKERAKLENRAFVYLEPQAGSLLMWESWLRHEVPPNASKEDRISVSFNYAWG